MLIQSISQIKHNKIQSNSKRSNNISQKTVNNVTLPSFADAKSLANINFKGVIHYYARDGYAYLVLEKIEEGVSVNDRGTDYNTPLIVACDNGKTKVVEKLLEQPDIDVNAQNVHGTTALMAVCRSKSDNIAIAEKLLNRPEIDVNIKNRDKNTALIWACCAGKTKIVEKLIDIPNIDVNAQNASGGTALMFAASFGFSDIVEKILQHPNVDVNLKDNKGKTALDFANSEIKRMIKSYQKGVDKRGVNKSSAHNSSQKSVKDVNLQDANGDTRLIRACRDGKTEEVKELLKNPDTDVNIQNEGKITALMVACTLEYNSIAEQLIQHPNIDINVQNKTGWTALMYAANSGNEKIVEKLLQHPNINTRIKNNFGCDAVYLAQGSKIEKMIANHKNTKTEKSSSKKYDSGINSRDEYDNTLLMNAVNYGNLKNVETLLKNPDIDVNVQDNYGGTALMKACNTGNADIVERLLQHPDIDVNVQYHNGSTALIWACRTGRTKIVENLINHPDIDVNIQDIQGNTALIWASNDGYANIVEKLLEHPDIDINLKDDKGLDALSYANDEIAQMIKNYQRGVDNRGINNNSVYNSQKKTVSDINLQDDDGNTSLISASRNGNIDEVEKLLQHPDIDVNIQDIQGNTALIWASFCGATETVEKILQHPDVDINLQDFGGNSALDWANKKNQHKIVKMIKNYKRGVDKRDISQIKANDKMTPLIQACFSNDLDKIEELLQNPDTNVNAKDNIGNTALIWASDRGYEEAIEKLLQHSDIDVNVQNRFNETALMCASANDNADIVEKLLQHPDINVNLKGEDGWTALIWASRNDNADVVEKLLLHPDIDVNAQSYTGNTALIWASFCGATETVEKILQHPDVDINLQDFGGNSALDWANKKNQHKIVKMIKNYKRGVDRREEVNKTQTSKSVSDINLQDDHGNTALSWACYDGSKKLVEKILQHPNVYIDDISKKYSTDEIYEMLQNYVLGVDKREGVIPKHNEIWTEQEKQTIKKLTDNKDYAALENLFETKGNMLNKEYDYFRQQMETIKELTAKKARETETAQIRKEERAAAQKDIENKIAELDKTKTEYDEKNKALDNLINGYNSMLADDVEDAKSGIRSLYGIKTEQLPENMKFGEQMIYVVDILSKHKDKLSNVSADSPKIITRALQDKSGKISTEDLKFLDRVLQISDKKCSESELVSAIDAVKNDKGALDMEKVSYFIANLSWGQNSISNVIKDVKGYNPQNN